MQLDILTPGKTLYSGEASVVTFPGADGKFQVMNDHAPLIATLAEGQVVIKDAKGKTESVDIAGGVVEISSNNISVLAR